MNKEIVDKLKDTLAKTIKNDITKDDKDSLWIVYMKTKDKFFI